MLIEETMARRIWEEGENDERLGLKEDNENGKVSENDSCVALDKTLVCLLFAKYGKNFFSKSTAAYNIYWRCL